MFGSEIIEVAIGLVFVYLMLCLLCSGIKEAVARVLAWRSKTLEAALVKMIDDPQALKELYEHPLVRELHLDRRYHKLQAILPVLKHRSKPSFISAQTFSTVIFDNLLKKNGGKAPADIQKTIGDLPAGEFKKTLQTLLNSVETKVAKAEETLTGLKQEAEKWFDDRMEQLSAWYKRKAKLFIFIIALMVTSVFNIDTFMIANRLYHNNTMRQAVINAAGKLAEQAEIQPRQLTDDVQVMIDDFYGEFDLLGIPIGWTARPHTNNAPAEKDPRQVPGNTLQWIYKVLGLLLSSIAVTLGAPFWFQKLKALVQLRNGKKLPPPTT